jgi:hypothetical protein
MACRNLQGLSIVSAELTGAGGDGLLRLGENPMEQGLLTEKARRDLAARPGRPPYPRPSKMRLPVPAPP